MKKTALLPAVLVLCACAWAADNVATAPQAQANLKSTIADGVDAITIPRMLSYQGKLTDTLGAPVTDSAYQVTFRLYTVPSGGSAYWDETQTVRTRAGLFSVLLGSVTPIASVPDAGALYLGMEVAAGGEMTPRLQLVSAAYAYKADTADYALAAPGGGGDNAWVRGTPDSVLYTAHRLGIARGGSNNMLYGTYRQSHTNFGVACTTGTSSANNTNITLSGGYGSTAQANYSTVGGGLSNRCIGVAATVAGGYANIAGDSVTDTCAVVAGGYGNCATTRFSTVSGGQCDTASGFRATVGGGYTNVASGDHATVGGGIGNTASDNGSTASGGQYNVVSGQLAVVGGGHSNTASEYVSTVGGGELNGASGQYATVSGGNQNVAAGSNSTVGGGYLNEATTWYATVGGGYYNTASGRSATVPGGHYNLASGYASFAAGNQAQARHAGSFVWSDSCLGADSVTTTAANQWRVRSRGGAWFYSNLAMTAGAYLAAGSNSWASIGDDANREDLRAVDGKALLDKVVTLPVRDYKLRDQDDATRHIGPVAQDFHAAFGCGETSTAINMADADGVLLAAVQALYDDNRALRAEVEALRAEIRGR